ncbi:ABC transporter permease subunit [Vagococcus sp. JNUCC 83]
MLKVNKESKIIYILISCLFLVFLIVPIMILGINSFLTSGNLSIENYINVLTNPKFFSSLKNSFIVSTCSAIVSMLIAFMLSYTLHFTRTNHWIKKGISSISVLPMFLPSITYGFAIMYAFGKQGILTKILGNQLFNIYGFHGLVLGYTLYTLPVSFLLLDNTMKYIDKKFIIVSDIMGDPSIKKFSKTILAPLFVTLISGFIQVFFLSFTDFGIPASLGGEYTVIASLLYNEMLGTVSNIGNGAVISIIMLLPSIISVLVLKYIAKYNVRYDKTSDIVLPTGKVRDVSFSTLSIIISVIILFIFATIFIVPFTKNWPYDLQFTTKYFVETIKSANLLNVYRNSLIVAIMTAILGTLLSYFSAILVTRSELSNRFKMVLDSFSGVSNTIPGMVLGISFLLTFSNTFLQYTFIILIVSNVIHFFSTPYTLAKEALNKIDSKFETTAELMGDTWIKSIFKIVIPNSQKTLLNIFSYYFTNSMVTISAVIFLVGAYTSVITTKIKELQHFGQFNQIFILSLLILVTNLFIKAVVLGTSVAIEKSNHRVKNILYAVSSLALLGLVFSTSMVQGTSSKVVIYSNADEEAIEVMQQTLDENGYKDEYIIQSYGTSELGGKIKTEGKNIEAGIVTLSSYYIEDAQNTYNMFLPFNITNKPIQEVGNYTYPIIGLEGALIVNTNLLDEKGLSKPTSIKELGDEKYRGLVSIPDIRGSSTGWLLIQALISEYGKNQAKEILSNIIKNVGPHLEESGSGPLKKVRTGEVAVAFGLKHQAIKDKNSGLPIDFVDPVEGNFVLQESLAIVNHGKKDTVEKMAQLLLDKGRKDIFSIYPTPLYTNEVSNGTKSKNIKMYDKKLTIALLEKHKKFFEESEKLSK